MSERLLPSDIELYSKPDYLAPIHHPGIMKQLCAEIRASWAEIEALRAIALAAAEEMMASPATDSPLFDAVRAWQKSQREKA